MRSDLSVIAPCYNEAENVVELTERLLRMFEKFGIKGEIVLVNDASTDTTKELIEGLVQKYPDTVVLVHHDKNKRMFQGWKSGLSAARGTYVALIDADLQNLPEDVGRLYREALFSNVDLVQGWRNHIGRSNESFARGIASRGLSALLNILFGMRSRDNKSAFVVARREVLQDILTLHYDYRYPQTFVGVSAHAKGYSIREIETLFQDRRLGQSFIADLPLKASVLTLVDVVKGLFEFRLRPTYDAALRNFLKQYPPAKKDEPLPFWRALHFKLYLFLFPLHHWTISYDAGRYYDDFKLSQWLPQKRIKEFQEVKLRKLITHAYYHVPFYRELFDRAAVRPEAIGTSEDLLKLPIINKGVIRDNLYLGLLSDNHSKKNLQRVRTSGSTGEPFEVFAEKKQLEMRWAGTQRALEWTGYRFGDRQVRLWHKYLGMKPVEIFKEKLDALLTRRKFIPAYEITDKNLFAYISSIMRFKPVLLDGYAESFNMLARFLQKNKTGGLVWGGHKPKGIMSSAQTLPKESRAIIEEVFGCGVFDKYGSREFVGGIAYQCEEREGYHIVAECNIVEVLKDGKPAAPGEVGELVITELNNYAMPLIRYKIGDLAVAYDPAKPCPCGRGLPLIGSVQGRVQSIVVGTKNQFVPGTFFNRVFFKHHDAIRQYQIVQERFGELRIKIIKANLFHEGVLSEIRSDIKSHMGDDLEIVVEYVETIPLGKTGKHQHCISKLDPAMVAQNLGNVILVESKA